ncbi:RNA methyltransferase [Herbiconiux sp. KACC 21604]|uniref:TrmH family RNA methyltransferase n=1 Tax=unclassified Herbiconiux TaxID=2618217 RepID=UPI00149191D4|nr:RNA methyltransferase [Herbiconiux sp. SALV-R1]QJU54710.1 RNA methyltransferase [Herbiconiux sp. SALV-R1]WPO85814.1 RNA methyltransferase [Herbiconiux sp. KACC 21604]
MPRIDLHDIADARLADFARATDVALKNVRRREPGREHGLYLAESLLVFERALAAGHRPRSVLALESAAAEALDALAAAGHPDTPVFVGSDDLLAELTGYRLHRALVASMSRPALRPVDELLSAPAANPAGDPTTDSAAGGARRIVVVENVVDPTNLGAIFRSAGAIGADAVLVTPQCSDPYYRRAIRVSMGTVLQVPWTRTGPWHELAPQLHARGFHIAALALTPDAVSLRDFERRLPERVALVLGAEGDGLTAEALAAADTVVSIPMLHGIDSLNVAAASAVAMWAVSGDR